MRAFDEILAEVAARGRGVRAAFLMDLDGMPIEVSPRAMLAEVEPIAAEYALLLREAAAAASDLGLGALRGLAVGTRDGPIALSLEGEEMAAGIRGDGGQPLALARRWARLVLADLRAEPSP